MGGGMVDGDRCGMMDGDRCGMMDGDRCYFGPCRN